MKSLLLTCKHINKLNLNKIILNNKNFYATSPTKSKDKLSDFKYCIESVKTNDFDSYLASVLTPKKITRAAFAVRAFHIELFSIKKYQKESQISMMKLQFWFDQFNKIFDGIKKGENIELFEPVSNELNAVIRHHNLSKVWFTRMIEGRKHYFSTQQFATLEELEKCADASMSSIYYILFNCMNIKNVDCDHAASHLGKAQMICGIVKNVLKSSAQNVYYIPNDLLIKHNISQQDLINFSERILRPKQKNIKDLAFELCTRAHQHLNSARSLSNKVPKEAQMILAPAVTCEVFLNEMEKHDFDLFDKRLNSEFRTKIVYKLILAKLKNKY